MSQEKSVEQRLLCLEDAVADLQRRVAALTPAGDRWKPIARSAEDLEAMKGAYELGRAIREADRPPGDEDDAP